MHPLLGRPARLLGYLALGAGAGLLLSALLRLVTPRPWADALAFAVPLAIVYAFALLSAWWVCRANPIAAGPRSALAQIGASVQVAMVWAIAGGLWAATLTQWAHMGPDRAGVLRDLGVLVAVGVPAYLVSAALHYLLLAFEASHRAERTALQSQVAAREAEVRALRAQLNPHFLFNSLNSINALVGSDPAGARRMCERLGEFLRLTLALGARDAVPLAEELALVERYLDIEQVRFGDRLRVERHIASEAAGCRVPPLLLQPLVENAIKHGIQDCVAGGVVRIDATRRDGALVLVVDNPVDPGAPKRAGEGVGLANVRRRLEMFGPRDTRLQSARVGDRHRVTLELPALDGADA